MTTFLSKLTVTQLKRPSKSSPQEQRRNKLIAKLEEQQELAKCQANGSKFIVMKAAWTRDDAGNKTKIQREKIVRPWFWADGAGMSMAIKYGSRPLSLGSKGQKALSIPNLETVPEVLGTVIEACRAGELDSAMEAAVAAGKSKQAAK